jgi:hypothetical protein
MIFHSTSDSNSAAASGDLTTIKQVYAELTDEPFRNVPFKGYLTNRNVIADTLLDMKRILPDELGEFDIELEQYFKFVLFGLTQVRQQSGETPVVRQEFEDFYKALSAQDEAMRENVNRYAQTLAPPASGAAPSPLFNSYMQVRRLVRELLTGVLLRMQPLFASYAGRVAMKNGMSTKGSYAGIADIFEFSQTLGRLISAPRKS